MPTLEQQKYWLGLHLIRDFGPVKLSRLLAHFDSAEALWLEPDAGLMRLNLPLSLLRQFCQKRRAITLDEELDRVQRAGASLICQADEAYPELLRSLANPPLLLYARGDISAAREKCLAIVGTRKASRYGWDVAHQLGRELAQAGITVVSGLAQGIDGAAHQGALAGGGRTIAVVATGIDSVYPRQHQELAEAISENGAILSEMPLGSPPLGKNFPQRNRIISGLSLGVLVAEAPAKSGALNTVAHANEQGREVFAVPQNIYNKMGEGCNILLQEGAKLVRAVDDILDELDVSFVASQTLIQAEANPSVDAAEEAILQHLSAEPAHVDWIVRQTDLPTATVTSALTMLELKGLAENAGPMQYCRARPPGN